MKTKRYSNDGKYTWLWVLWRYLAINTTWLWCYRIWVSTYLHWLFIQLIKLIDNEGFTDLISNANDKCCREIYWKNLIVFANLIQFWIQQIIKSERHTWTFTLFALEFWMWVEWWAIKHHFMSYFLVDTNAAPTVTVSAWIPTGSKAIYAYWVYVLSIRHKLTISISAVRCAENGYKKEQRNTKCSKIGFSVRNEGALDW